MDWKATRNEMRAFWRVDEDYMQRDMWFLRLDKRSTSFIALPVSMNMSQVTDTGPVVQQVAKSLLHTKAYR